MGRKINRNESSNLAWAVHRDDDGTSPTDHAQLAVLMDIRDELQRLNRVIGCENFLQIPALLRMIRANTAKPRRRKRSKWAAGG